jgi:hypothetical protein
VLLAASILACSAEMRALHRQTKARTELAEVAGDYWTAVRWGEASKLGAFYAASEDQLAVTRVAGNTPFKVSDASIVQVVVGAELPKEREPDTREGVALVRIEAYDIRRNRLEVSEVEQHWLYREPRGWIVDVAKSPVGAETAW